MAQNETWLKHDLLDAVKVQYLDGNLFSMDNAGNLIGVTLTRDGEDYSGGGSVSANVIRSDGGTVAVSGALSGKTATVVLPQSAYAVPGVVSVVVKLTVSGQVTTIAAIVANVYRSSTDTAIDPGTIIPSIQSLISQINTAVASIPADYSALWTKLAPAFSPDASYVAGQYVTYNSGLWRFNTSHSGSWSSSDVTAVNLGGEISDLKSAFQLDTKEITGAMPIVFQPGWYNTANTGGTATYTNDNTGACAKIAVTPGDVVTIHGGALSAGTRLYVFEDSEGKTFSRSQANLNGTYTVTVPTGAVYMYINNFFSVMASGYWAYIGTPIVSILPTIDDMQDDIEKLEFGGTSSGNLMSGGLISGYYAGSGNIVASNSLSHIIVNVQNVGYVKIDGIIYNHAVTDMDPIGVFFDGNGDKVKAFKATNLPVVIQVPTGAVTLGINTDYKASDYPSSLPSGMYCSTFTLDTNKNYSYISEGKKIKTLAGILRNDGTGWALLNNDDHEPLSMATVEVTEAGLITVNYGFTASMVLTLVACPDETFAKKYSIGGSVGLDKATFNIYELAHTIGGKVDYNATTGVWTITDSTFTNASFNSTNGELTLTHESIAGVGGNEKYNFHAQGRKCNVWAGRVTDTTVVIQFLDASGNVITNPTTDLHAYVTRQVNARLINANNLESATGNFWLYGAMEVN